MADPSRQPTAAETRSPSRPERLPWLNAAGIVLVLAVLFVVYAPSLEGPFVFDDADSIEKNPTIRQLDTALAPPRTGGITVSGRPVLNLSLALNLAVFGPEPRSFRLVNVALHGLSGLVLLGLLRRTLRSAPLQALHAHRETFSLGVVALWLLHPLQTESVAYVIQRAESLVAFFFLLTLYCFSRAASSGRSVWYALSILACAAGMASKEVMVSAPLIVLLYDRTFVAGSFAGALRLRWRTYAGLASTWILLAYLVASTGGRGGSVGANESVTAGAYLLTQAKAIALYLRLCLWPAGLVFDYGTMLETSTAAIAGGFVVVGGLAVATAIAVVRWPAAGFLGMVFFAVLGPSSSVIPVVTQVIAEHRMYLPLACVIILIAALAAPRFGKALPFAMTAAAVVLSAVTWKRCHVYADAVTLWSDTVKKRPMNPRAHNNLGVALMEADRPGDAMASFEAAITLDPKAVDGRVNLGKALLKQGRPAEALVPIEAALRLRPEHAAARLQRGNTLLELGRAEEAVQELSHGIELDADVAGRHFNLANALAAAGRLEEAVEHYETTIAARPNDAEAHSNLGVALRDLGRTADALRHGENAVRLAPESARARNNLALALLSAGQQDQALVHLETALQLQPNFPEARLNLAAVLTQSGKLAEATRQYEEVFGQIDPTVELRNQLGVLYAQQKRWKDARRQFLAALELDPTRSDTLQNLATLERVEAGAR